MLSSPLKVAILAGLLATHSLVQSATLKDFEDVKIYNLEKEYRELKTYTYKPEKA